MAIIKAPLLTAYGKYISARNDCSGSALLSSPSLNILGLVVIATAISSTRSSIHIVL
jgi:hypothetical protein